MAASNEKAQLPTAPTTVPAVAEPVTSATSGVTQDAVEPSTEQKAGQATGSSSTTAATEGITPKKESLNHSQEPSATSTKQPGSTLTPSALEVVDKGSLSTDTTHTVTVSSQPSGGSSTLRTASPSQTATKTGAKAVTSNGQAKGASKSRRRSFFRKLSWCIPCVSSSSKAHSILDEEVTTPTKPTEQVDTTNEKAPTPKPTVDTPSTPDVGTSPVEVPAPLTIVPVGAVTSTADGDVVRAPSPTKSLLPEDETEGLTSGAVQPPGSTIEPLGHHAHSPEPTSTSVGSGDGEDSETNYTDEDLDEIEVGDEEERLILNGGAGIPIGPDGQPKPLLPPMLPQHVGRKCLVLDLDETLVHSSFKSISQADYVVPVEIEFNWHNVYVIKRPGVDNFLKKMGEIYEVVVFTASLSKYADPVLDKLDIHQVVAHRLFRESCFNHRGNYVKDLSQLGRPIQDTIILDNSPASYIFHPNNAVPVSSWFNDPHDTELTDLVPFLGDLCEVDDIRGVLDGGL